MKPRILIAPAPLKEIEQVYGPILAAGGCELAFSKVNHQMNEAELMEVLPGCAGSLAGSEPYTRAVLAAAAATGLKVIARAGVGYDAVDLDAANEHGIRNCRLHRSRHQPGCRGRTHLRAHPGAGEEHRAAT